VKPAPSNLLVWFGVLGGGLAWSVTFVAGLAFTLADCADSSSRLRLPLQSWQSGLSAAGAAIGLAALAVTVRLYSRSAVADIPGAVRHGDDAPPPQGRVNFLAVVGMVVNTLTIAIMVMTAVGAPMLNLCQQA
jgi:hypothetical protein